METSVIATVEPGSTDVQRKAVRVAQRLVGGLPGESRVEADGRVERLAVKLARLVEADATASSSNRRRARRA
jgi:hypothetical protein